MNNKELNEACAKALGLHQYRNTYGIEVYSLNEVPICHVEDWNPCIDAEQAMLCLGWLEEQKKTIFISRTARWWIRYDTGKDFGVSGETFYLAICKAVAKEA